MDEANRRDEDSSATFALSLQVAIPGTNKPEYDDDERGEFWMNWTRQVIARTLTLAGALIMLAVVPGGWLHTAVRLAVAYILTTMGGLAIAAVRLVIDNRRARNSKSDTP